MCPKVLSISTMMKKYRPILTTIFVIFIMIPLVIFGFAEDEPLDEIGEVIGSAIVLIIWLIIVYIKCINILLGRFVIYMDMVVGKKKDDESNYLMFSNNTKISVPTKMYNSITMGETYYLVKIGNAKKATMAFRCAEYSLHPSLHSKLRY